MNVIYKIKDNIGAYCSKCGKWASNPVWIGFDDETEAPYGNCCAKKYKILNKKSWKNKR